MTSFTADKDLPDLSTKVILVTGGRPCDVRTSCSSMRINNHIQEPLALANTSSKLSSSMAAHRSFSPAATRRLPTLSSSQQRPKTQVHV